ncbi:hypothetical protein, partial [Xanthomonas oryzae]
MSKKPTRPWTCGAPCDQFCRLPPAALRVVLHADDKKTTTTSSCWLMRTHALKAHFLRTCSRSPEQQCQERQVEELQAGIESPLKNPQATSIARLNLRFRRTGIASVRYATS